MDVEEGQCGSSPGEEQLMNINDYSQNEKSSSEHDEPEDSPFDELEHILAQDDNRLSRNESILALKLADLHEKNATLTRSNQHLTRTIELLQLDLQQQNDAQIDEPTLNDFIEVVERELSALRVQMEQYREKQQLGLKVKDEELGKLRELANELAQEKNYLEQERSSLIDSNEEITKTNQNLIQEIENLENQLMENRSEAQSSRSYRYNSRRDTGFEGEVQAELENLIEKLVAELEFERGQKRRLSEEIKRMQANIMQLQREMATKTNKIYTLEMSYLKSNRLSPRNDKPHEKAQDRTLKYSKSNAQLSQERSSRSDRTAPKSFTLMELLNDHIDASQKERLVICSKIIDFYLRKLSAREYATFMLEHLLICNFNKANPHLLIVRKDPAAPPHSGELSQEKLIWNLGFVLENVINQSINYKEEKSQAEEELINLINAVLEENSCGVNDVHEMKHLIDSMVRSRK